MTDQLGADAVSVDAGAEDFSIKLESFEIPADFIEGAPAGVPIQITPEVTNVLRPDGKLLTLKVIYHVSPSIDDSSSWEKIDRLFLGTLGQNDPFRMWAAAKNTAVLLGDEGYRDSISAEVEHQFGNGSKVKLENYYGEHLKVFNRLSWYDAPIAVLIEVERRIQQNEPLNYQFLAFMMRDRKVRDFVGDIERLRLGEVIRNTAMAEMRKSNQHKKLLTRRIMRGEEIYPELESVALGKDIKFNVAYEGINLYKLKNSDKESLLRMDFPTLMHTPILSDNPAINFTANVISKMFRGFEMFEYKIQNARRSSTELYVSQIRDTMINRFYRAISAKLPDESHGMTLGQFASQVYQYEINNMDRMLMDFLKNEEFFAGDES
jgi:hypothetical protein